MRQARRRSGSRLTLRQPEVPQLLAEGLSMKQVARALEVSTRTVQYHKYTIMKEQGIDSNPGLLQLAIEEYLIPGAGERGRDTHAE
ncbi:MAG: response regulator transcription factor [Planctomycetota bacterium]